MRKTVETLFITKDNTARVVKMTEKRVVELWNKKVTQHTYITRDGRSLPIKDILLTLQTGKK
jgi:hypothetical protein